MTSDNRKEFLEFVNDSLETWGPWYGEADRDMLSYAGDNWTLAERHKLAMEGRTALEFNKVRRAVNAIDGIQRDNRLSTIIGPVEGSDQKTADQLSEVLQYVYDKDNAHYYTSAAFADVLKVGLGFVGVYMDYSKDPVYGDIRFYNRQYNTLVLDPYFTRFDLSDCAAVASRDFVTVEQAKALLPGVSDDDIESIPKGVVDARFRFQGFGVFDSIGKVKDLLTYDQYWRRVNKRARVLIDQETGEMTEWPKGDKEAEDRLKFIVANSDKLQLINRSVNSIEYCVFLGGQEMYAGVDPTGLDRYPFAVMLGFWEPQLSRYSLKLQGLVRSMRDAQVEYNKRHSKIIDIMDSMLNSGWIQTDGALKDPEDLLQSGQGRIITMHQGKFFGQDLHQVPPPQVPPGLFQYQELLDNNIMELGGLNASLLGVDEGGNTQISGRLAQVRASNGIKANRNVFDQYEFSLKVLGEIVLDTIQKNYGAGKVRRIINEEPTQEFYNGSFGRFDAMIKQGVLSQSQRDAFYFELVNLKREGIVNIPEDVIIKNLPINGQSELLEIIEQQQQQQQQQARAAFEAEQRQARLQESVTQGNIALAVERIGRAEADKGLAIERTSESQQNQSTAILNMVKAAQEVDETTIRQAQGLFDLRRGMQQEQEEITQRRFVQVKEDELKEEQQLQDKIPPQQQAKAPVAGVNMNPQI
jgi:hypothetical protein